MHLAHVSIRRRHSQPLGVSHSRPPGRLLDGDQLVQSAINNSDGDSDKELNYGHRLLQQQQSLRPSELYIYKLNSAMILQTGE